jgi:putative transposase
MEMIRTHIFPCNLPKVRADALNCESGHIYTRTMVEHYRIFRHTGHWMSKYGLKKLDDTYHQEETPLLHSHSIDAAQEAFHQACRTAKANRDDGAHYPRHLKQFRTTSWKNTGIRKREEFLLLALARGNDPLRVMLPSHLVRLPAEAFSEARLVWDMAAQHYFWHLVVEDSLQPPTEPPGEMVGAGDLGEIHPLAATDGEEAMIFTARELRSIKQNTARRLSMFSQLQSTKTKFSRSWKRLQTRKNRFLAQQECRIRDIEHKVSRAVVDWAVVRGWRELALGDVRNVADGKRLRKKSQQKISIWSHGRMRQYLTYKAEAAGIAIPLVKEAYSSQTCPRCGHRHKPKGRNFVCPACGFRCARDTVGSVNILSRYTKGEVGKILPPAETKYRHPFNRTGKRSRLDTAEMAGVQRTPQDPCASEAMPL